MASSSTKLFSVCFGGSIAYNLDGQEHTFSSRRFGLSEPSSVCVCSNIDNGIHIIHIHCLSILDVHNVYMYESLLNVYNFLLDPIASSSTMLSSVSL